MRPSNDGIARLWHRSVFAQTSMVLCAALLAAQGIAFWLFCGERAVVLREAAKAGFVDTLHLAATAPAALPPGDATRFLWLSEARPDMTSLRAAPPELLARLEPHRLALPWPVGAARANAPEVARTAADELSWWPVGARGVALALHPSGAGYVGSLVLDDGRRLNGLFATPAWTSPLASQNWTLHAVTLGLMMLASVLLSRRLTGPMRRFAHAAGEVGRGRRAVLPRGGPNEVRRTAEAFDAMQRRIIALVDDRTHLLSAIGHDLRTPLTSARLRVHLVEQTHLRERLLGDLDRVERITESALDLVRGLAEEAAVRVDLRALLDEVATDFGETGADATLVADDVPVIVTCRPVMLRRAVTNLVDNAIKYGRGAELSVRRGDPHEGHGTDVVIRVRDRGEGIDMNRVAEAFEPFRRLEGSRSRATGGAGLGLTLARSVARRHGGDVTLARAEDGPGLVATLRFPVG